MALTLSGTYFQESSQIMGHFEANESNNANASLIGSLHGLSNRVKQILTDGLVTGRAVIEEAVQKLEPALTVRLLNSILHALLNKSAIGLCFLYSSVWLFWPLVEKHAFN